ncbi:hypothetical protein Esti_000186 [Eimeria stiedai]
MAEGPQMRRRYAEPQASSTLQPRRPAAAAAAAPALGGGAATFDSTQQQQQPVQQLSSVQQQHGPPYGGKLPPQSQQQAYQQQQPSYEQQQRQQHAHQRQQQDPSSWGHGLPVTHISSSRQRMQQQQQQQQREMYGQQQPSDAVYAHPQRVYQHPQQEAYQQQQQSYHGGPSGSVGGRIGGPPQHPRRTPVRPPMGPPEGEEAAGIMSSYGGPQRDQHYGGPLDGRVSQDAFGGGTRGPSSGFAGGPLSGSLGGPMGGVVGGSLLGRHAGTPLVPQAQLGGGPMGAPVGGHMGGGPLGAPMEVAGAQLSNDMQRMQQGPPQSSWGLALFGGLLGLFTSQKQLQGAPSSAAAAAAATGAPSDSEDPFENEPPLLEDLGINPGDIWKRTKAVLLFNKADHDLLAGCDLCGPLMIALVLALILFLAGKASFGCLYGMSIIGSLSAYLLLNLISRGDGIDLYRTASILGYSLLPVALVALPLLVLERQGLLLRLGVSALGVGWATRTASSFFEAALRLQEQRFLVAYPIFLLYASFTILTLF